MNIIVMREPGSKPVRLKLSPRRLVLWTGLAGLAVVMMTGTLGFLLGDHFGLKQGAAGERIEQMRQDLVAQHRVIDTLREENDRQLNAFALRLGELQARSSRLEALGERLTQIGHLEDGEFSFGEPPALGGAVIDEAALPDRIDVNSELSALESRLGRQARELGLLESLIADRQLDRSLEPAGRPVQSGWLSSRFGNRVDPFSGEPDYHPGIDFSGTKGDPIVAVADGVVVRADRHHQYGYVIDLDHGNGYVTRYAHNSENLVAVGARVRVGDVIARMGSTGRATGNHVHFEVFHRGRRVDPMQVVSAIRT